MSFAVTAAILGVASMAWACTASLYAPYVTVGEVNRALAGSQVLVTGGHWSPHSDVEIRWGDVRLLWVTPEESGLREGEISATVTIPADAAPGTYYLSAAQGAVTTSNVVPFVVAEPGAAPPSDPPGPNDPGSGGPGSDGSADGLLPGSSGPTSRSTGGGSATGGSSSGSSATASPVPTAAAVTTAGQAVAAKDVAAKDVGVASPVAPVAATPTPAAAGPSKPIPVADAVRSEPAAPRPAPVVALDDLWSGFDASRLSPSLADLPDANPAGGPMVPGMSVLVYGSLALASGFGLAELRRRRVLRTS